MRGGFGKFEEDMKKGDGIHMQQKAFSGERGKGKER